MINIIKMETSLFIPITFSSINTTEQKLNFIGIKGGKNLTNAIDFASSQYNISPEFIIALASTESDFKENALSKKGYKGLMQIPQNVPIDANILIGSYIFRKKMSLVNNDIEKAICLYKGYKIGSKEGKKQAKKVIDLYNTIRGRI